MKTDIEQNKTQVKAGGWRIDLDHMARDTTPKIWCYSSFRFLKLFYAMSLMELRKENTETSRVHK